MLTDAAISELFLSSAVALLVLSAGGMALLLLASDPFASGFSKDRQYPTLR